MLDDMWETVNDYNAHAKADNCILFIKDIHFSIFCHETITGLRLLAPTVCFGFATCWLQHKYPIFNDRLCVLIG